MDLTSRVQQWIVSNWGQQRDAAPAAPGPMGEPDLDAIRQAMRMVVAPCSSTHRARAAGQIARAANAVELWLLRSSLYQYLAQDLGQAAAAERMEALMPLFKDAVPGRVRMPDNTAHERRLH